jgi:hypothetical protein
MGLVLQLWDWVRPPRELFPMTASIDRSPRLRSLVAEILVLM